MALPSSGPLSFQDIATELGVNPPLSLADMSTTAGFTAPYAVTNFYGYSGGGVITDGLVLYVDASNPASYSGTGTTWYDLSPNGYNGTLSGNATYNSGNGGYISLQSNTGFIDFGSSSDGSNTSSYTWGAWVKFSDVSSTNIFMARGRSGWNLAAVMLTTGFNASMVTTVPFTNQINSVYSTTPVANTWYYYTAVFDAGVSLKVYINGVLSATQNASSTNLRNSGEGWSSTNGTYFNADYGSMIVYNTALTDAEVLQNYDATKERFGIVTTGLTFNFDAANYSGTGDTWTDDVSNNVGTLIDNPTYSTDNGGYFNFNGSSNYVTVPDNSTLSLNPYLTLETWIYPTSDNYNMIITKQPSGGQPSPYAGNYELRLQPTGKMGFGWQYDYPSQYGYAFMSSNNNVLTLNAWNQVVATSQTVNNTQFYVNGSLISVNVEFNYPQAQSSPPMAVNNQPLLLGRRQDGLPFAGRYAIARGYNVILDASQVLQNFNVTKSRFGL